MVYEIIFNQKIKTDNINLKIHLQIASFSNFQIFKLKDLFFNKITGHPLKKWGYHTFFRIFFGLPPLKNLYLLKISKKYLNHVTIYRIREEQQQSSSSS
jgi:hypothetical protein